MKILINSCYEMMRFRAILQKLLLRCSEFKNINKQNLESVLVKDNVSNSHVENLKTFILTIANDYLEAAENLRSQRLDRKTKFLELCYQYNAQGECDKINNTSLKMENLLDEIYDCKIFIKKNYILNTSASIKDDLIKNILKYKEEKKNFDLYRDNNDMNVFLFYFEELNEKDFWTEKNDDIYQLIKNSISIENIEEILIKLFKDESFYLFD